MEKKEKVVIFENSLAILRHRTIWPRVGDELRPGKLFYGTMFFGYAISVCIMNGNWVHLVKSIRDNEYHNIDMDICASISFVGMLFFNLNFALFVKEYAHIIKNLTDFESFGKPINFDEENKKLNFYSRIHGIYIYYCIVVLAYSSTIKFGWCADKSYYECGVFIQPYMPFDIDHYPGRLFFFLTKFMALCFTYQTSASLSFLMFEIVEQINLRLDDVMKKFKDALKEKNKNQLRDLKKAIQYHNFVIELFKEFNYATKRSLFTHLLFTGIILGSMVYLSISKFTFDVFGIIMGYFSSLALVSSGGQRIQEKSVSVSYAVYDTPWYNLDVKIQKLLIMVIVRARNPLHVRAGPFGIMNYALIVGVLKTSYSCLTFLLTSTRKIEK